MDAQPRFLLKESDNEGNDVVIVEDEEMKVEKFGKKKRGLERYQKWCLMPGCLAGSQETLSNHIIRCNSHLSTDERLAFLKQAKLAVERKPQNVVTVLTIQKAFSSIRNKQASIQKNKGLCSNT